jgi:hypothetical protein
VPEISDLRVSLNQGARVLGGMGLAYPTTVPPRRTSTPSSHSKVVVPVRYAAWLAGDLGRTLERTLQASLDGQARVTRLPRAFLVESTEAPGPLLEAVHRATLELETGIQAAYPIFHHEMGPVWTGTLQCVFN